MSLLNGLMRLFRGTAVRLAVIRDCHIQIGERDCGIVVDSNCVDLIVSNCVITGPTWVPAERRDPYTWYDPWTGAPEPGAH